MPHGQVDVGEVHALDPEVRALVDALTGELAGAGYRPEETFGYPPEQLAASGVHLVGARVAGELAGIGGVEVQTSGLGELKRFFVTPAHRGSGVADAVLAALLEHAARQGVRVLRLETGDEQHAAIRFYRRHGFVEVPRFGPYAGSARSVCMARDVVPAQRPQGALGNGSVEPAPSAARTCSSPARISEP
jgi:putative acetyltransferase